MERGPEIITYLYQAEDLVGRKRLKIQKEKGDGYKKGDQMRKEGILFMSLVQDICLRKRWASLLAGRVEDERVKLMCSATDLWIDEANNICHCFSLLMMHRVFSEH